MPRAEDFVPSEIPASKVLNASEVADVTQNTIENSIRQKNAAIVGWLTAIERELRKPSYSQDSIQCLAPMIQNVIRIAADEGRILVEMQQALVAYAEHPEQPVMLDQRYKSGPIWRLESNSPSKDNLPDGH